MPHRRIPMALVLAAALLLAGVAALVGPGVVGAEPSPSADADVTLRIGWQDEPDNLNPFIGIYGESYMMWHLNYDFLVGFDPETLEPRPEVAESWETSDDGKTWAFTIRQGMKWHDGRPVTANDVAFTFNYIIDNKLDAFSDYMTFVETVEATDDTHVVVTCSRPKAGMLQMLVPILPEHKWSGISGKAAARSFQNPPPIVGSGPFQIVAWDKGKYVKLKANRDYWAGAPRIDTLIFQLYTNADSMVSDLELGNIDGISGVPPAQFKRLGGRAGITTNQGSSWRFTELAMNCYEGSHSRGHPVLKDQRFRQAVNWAIDRDKIVDVALQGYATPGTSLIVPQSMFHWEPPAGQAYGFEPEKARRLLDEAGYPDTNGDGTRETEDGKAIKLRLYVTADSPQNQTAAKLIVGWLRDVGIDTTLQVMDDAALLDAQYAYEGTRYAPDWDMFIWGWSQDVDPSFITGIHLPAQIEGWSDCLWTDEQYTRLYEQQSTDLDPDSRAAKLAKMQEIFYEGGAYAILAYPFELEAYDTSRWDGWVHVPSDGGVVLFNYNNVDTYRLVHLKQAADEGAGGQTNVVVIVVVIVVAAALAIAALVVVRSRRRHRTTEEL